MLAKPVFDIDFRQHGCVRLDQVARNAVTGEVVVLDASLDDWSLFLVGRGLSDLLTLDSHEGLQLFLCNSRRTGENRREGDFGRLVLRLTRSVVGRILRGHAFLARPLRFELPF